MNVKLGADAVPETLTTRVPVAVTLLPCFGVPLNVIVPSLRLRRTVVLLAGGTLIRALGFAVVEPAANDHLKE